jgi:hypothetical protein
VLDSLKPVGYHVWLNADTVFVFVLDSGDAAAPGCGGSAEILARDVRRTLLVPRRRAVSYVQNDSLGRWVRSLEPTSGAGENVAPLPDGTEFYAWTPQGELLSTRGNELVRWSKESTQWETVARFSEPGLRKITRLAVSPAGDRIALVGEDGTPPQ